MAKKSSLQKIQETVVETVKGVVKDPAGAAGKAAEQAKGVLAVGKMVAGQVTKTAAGKVATVSGRKSAPPGPLWEEVTDAPADKPVGKSAEVTPIDVARVVAKKPMPAKKPPAKKAPAKKVSTPSGKLPPRKPTAETPAAAAATVARAAPAKKAPAKKTAAKKPPAKKAAVKKSPGSEKS